MSKYRQYISGIPSLLYWVWHLVVLYVISTINEGPADYMFTLC